MAERALLIPAIVGPTASGKTAVSLALGQMLDAEIVCCDSMQIYRDMAVGTAKPTAAERAVLPHHLTDFVAPGTPYSASDYARAARASVRAILDRGKLPLFCGGTGLYLDAARYGIADDGDGLPGRTPMREELDARAAREGGREDLFAELCRVDPEAAAAAHPNNVRRVVRALEIYYATGKTKSEWDRESRARAPLLPVLPLYLVFHDRETLYRRVEARVDRMMEDGLLEETRRLLDAGVLSPETTAGQAIGYKELAAALRGEKTPDEAVADLKTASRRYAKRQITWFSADETAVRIFADREDGGMRDPGEIAEECRAVYEEKSKN